MGVDCGTSDIQRSFFVMDILIQPNQDSCVLDYIIERIYREP